MVRMIVVGQTPPPYHGQAVMIEKTLVGDYAKLQLFHVPMNFSADMEDVGKFQLKKVFHLFWVIGSIIFFRFRYNIRILYYPPAGPTPIAIYRDMIILIATRWLFDRTVFHFHAGGLSTTYDGFSPLLQLFFRFAYFRPDLAIRLSKLNPEDGKKLQASQDLVLPYGIEDSFHEFFDVVEHKRISSRLLYVGSLQESKGVLVLLEAAQILKNRGLQFELQLMGKCISTDFQYRIQKFISVYQLEDTVQLLGVQTGVDKWRYFAEAGIFCFPTFYPSETFGLVVLEAMQFQLPIVATDWRGVADLVDHGLTGYLVSPSYPAQLADAIEQLIRNPDVAQEMGRRGREKYQQQYTLSQYYSQFESAIVSLAMSSHNRIR